VSENMLVSTSNRIAEVVKDENGWFYVIVYGEYVATCKWQEGIAKAICDLINASESVYKAAMIAADVAGEMLRVLKAIAKDKNKDAVQL
jgi:hypothetical protein